MKLRILFLLLVISIKNNAQIADRAFNNGKIYTGNNTFAQAIAIKNGKLFTLVQMLV